MKELAPEHLHWRYDKKTNGSSQSFHPFHQVLGWHSIWQIEGGCSRHLAGWHPLCPDCTGHMGWPIQTVHEGGSYRCKPLDYCLWFQLIKFVSECFLFILSKVTISFIFWWFLRNIHCLSKYLCLGVWSCTHCQEELSRSETLSKWGSKVYSQSTFICGERRLINAI